MNSGTLQIQLSYQDPETRQDRRMTFTPPIAIGRVFQEMPNQLDGRRVSRLVLNQDRISRYHALIDLDLDQVVVIDQNSRNGIFVNGVRQTQTVLVTGDILQIGHYEITVKALPQPSIIQFNPNTGLPDPNSTPSPIRSGFPPSNFLDAQQVSLQELEQTGEFQPQIDEFDYAALGAGLGSYIWVDLLRIFGVKTHQIIALGTQAKPYAKYKQLCLNSQIPLHERLRSNSDSCPDNIWGWPSYALREAWHDFLQGKIGNVVRYLWQVFSEPILIETYTPRAGNVFDSIDREANRISWEQIYRYGSIRAIRKTADQRYAIAYSKGGGNYGFIVAKYLHLATGYPAIRFLPHLQNYRDQTQDLKSVVNAYEAHDHIYEHLRNQGGVVLIQGRGIVASRIIQKVDEIRCQTRQPIEIIHLMRRPLSKGHKYGFAQRSVQSNWEFQPFNWPKACWGGDLREQLEQANPEKRQEFMKVWGGTTTADRRDWQQITQAGIREKWYKIKFGMVERVEKKGDRIQCIYQELEAGQPQGVVTRDVDFIIDATGLDAEVKSTPLLKDLVEHHQLPILENGRLAVANDFELVEMQNGSGRMYAAGAITLGGPYAAVDSFLGLQYSALSTVDSLTKHKAPQLRYLKGLNSLSQWWKWINNQSP